ncbi:unnamed protein product [Coffea canephora]|uniref:Uncharacterized protein n=1 Tax=Coffea canephora TaxID=49390 RepID=A0A068TKS8_COFCA|nr:unnamed protein product [Coffea canephora]
MFFISIAQAANPQFKVEGEVYCDKCRAQLKNRLSEPMPGTNFVYLEPLAPFFHARHLTYSLEGQTEASTIYSLEVEGDHEDEICEDVLVKSNKPDCSEIPKQGLAQASSRISLTANNGIVD